MNRSDEGKSVRWQFSIRYLLAELALVAVGSAIIRFLIDIGDDEFPWSMEFVVLPAAIVAIMCFGAAFGGLFNRMIAGAVCALCFCLFYLIFLAPRVQ